MLASITGASICAGQTLRAAADSAGVLIGTAVRPSQFGEKRYASVLAREFNMVEPEDALKWLALRPDQRTYDFRAGDEVVRFAQQHQMKVRGHCLVWGRDNPDWLVRGNFSSRQLSRLLHDHISRVMKHYAGQVFAWDVVNEALDEKGELRDSIWYNQPGIGFAANGTAYIEQVFRWAHKADPHALLFYNEAEGEDLGRKSDAVYAMVEDFKQRGVPIAGVGLQMHIPSIDVDIAAESAAISANIARLSAIGVQVHITELDVSVPVDSSGTASPGDLQRQAELYRSVVRACLLNRGCSAIQTWGFTDKYSWIRSHSRGKRGNALLFDRDYEPKPSYKAVLQELSSGRISRYANSVHSPK
ncbi:MAG: endo-1,4-beta-xylanase [Candidatus Sulfotelmatobacter sp.]